MKVVLTDEDFKDQAHATWLYNFLKVRKWLSGPTPTPFQELSASEIRSEVLSSMAGAHRKTIFPGGIRNVSTHMFRHLTEQYERSKLHPSEYNFITKLTPRIKNLIWLYIRNLHAYETVQGGTFPYPDVKDSFISECIHYLPKEPIYPYYTLTTYPITPREITDAITDFLNLWEADATLKREHLAQVRSLIDYVKSFNTAFRWLSADDTNQGEWAYNYLKYRNILQNSYPIATKGQYYDAIVASFDYWNCSYEAKKLFLKDMRQAWSTKKFRDKQVGKKPFNFIMSKKIAKMLDNLADDGDLSKSEIVEKLITVAHSQLQDNKSKF